VRIEQWMVRLQESVHPRRDKVGILVAIGVDRDGFRHVLGVQGGAKEDKESWMKFLRHIKSRWLKGVRLFVSDKCFGLVESLADFYPHAHGSAASLPFTGMSLPLFRKEESKKLPPDFGRLPLREAEHDNI